METRLDTQVNGKPDVQIEDTKVLIKDLAIEDRDLAEYLSSVPDAAATAIEALKLGARILRLAGTSGDVEMVKREFEGMTTTINTAVERVLSEARSKLSERLTQFGTQELEVALRKHQRELNQEIERLFGSESAVSVQKQIDELLRKQAEAYSSSLKNVIEPSEDPENPFNRLRQDVAGEVAKATAAISNVHTEVMKIVGEAKGVAAEAEKGTAKGRTYQELVFEHVSDIARHFGDTAVYVADQPGLKGQSKAGDVVVEINPQESSNSALQVAFEAKNQAGISIPKLLRELEEAKENRAAASAVAVFSSAGIVPAGVGLWRDYPARRFVCVLDKEVPEPIMLEFTYRCARFEALRAIAPAERRFDITAVRNVIQSIRTRVGALQQMKTKLTGASSAIDEVQRLIENHREEIRHDLEEFDRLLAAGGESPQEEPS